MNAIPRTKHSNSSSYSSSSSKKKEKKILYQNRSLILHESFARTCRNHLQYRRWSYSSLWVHSSWPNQHISIHVIKHNDSNYPYIKKNRLELDKVQAAIQRLDIDGIGLVNTWFIQFGLFFNKMIDFFHLFIPYQRLRIAIRIPSHKRNSSAQNKLVLSMFHQYPSHKQPFQRNDYERSQDRGKIDWIILAKELTYCFIFRFSWRFTEFFTHWNYLIKRTTRTEPEGPMILVKQDLWNNLLMWPIKLCHQSTTMIHCSYNHDYGRISWIKWRMVENVKFPRIWPRRLGNCWKWNNISTVSVLCFFWKWLVWVCCFFLVRMVENRRKKIC